MSTEISNANFLANIKVHTAISERARRLVKDRFNIRGRFTRLEELSGISSDQWRNFYYAKQRINEKMLEFLAKKFPDEEALIFTGRDEFMSFSPPLDAGTPFHIPAPKIGDCETIGQRLNWVIREWASYKGNNLFNYLHELSAVNGKAISAEEWAQLVLGVTEPTIDMVVTVCSRRRHLTMWVLFGSSVEDLQVDPTDYVSVSDWLSHFRDLAELEESKLAKSTPEHPADLPHSKKRANKKS